MLHPPPSRASAAWIAVLGAALPLCGCSSLTHPEEIAIAAEPLPTQAAPAPAAPQPAMPRPAAAPGTG